MTCVPMLLHPLLISTSTDAEAEVFETCCVEYSAMCAIRNPMFRCIDVDD